MKCAGFFVQVSKISLVDLAGSERAKDTGAEGKRLQVRERGREKRDGGWREGMGRREREREREREAYSVDMHTRVQVHVCLYVIVTLKDPFSSLSLSLSLTGRS